MKKNIFERHICSFCAYKEQCDKKIIICIKEPKDKLITLMCDKYKK